MRKVNEKGFTLIELLLVVVVMGLMLAVIVPRGQRATTDAKYSLVRQNCGELAAFGLDWIEQQILAQDESSTATQLTYLNSLAAQADAATYATAQAVGGGSWIASTAANNNWNNANNTRTFASGNMSTIVGRIMDGAAAPQLPENTVEDIIEPAKVPRNPFNGAAVFNASNYDVASSIPGAIAVSVDDDASLGAAGNYAYYAFIFQGTDNNQVSNAAPNNAAVAFHGGMDNTLTGLRQGVFFARVRY